MGAVVDHQGKMNLEGRKERERNGVRDSRETKSREERDSGR